VSNLYLTDIGYYPHATYHYINRQKAIDQYVLIYCVDGSGWYRIDEKEYKVRKNQFFILPAGKPHTYGADEGNEWTSYWIHFRGYLASLYTQDAHKPQEINITTTSRVSERHNIFEEIFHTLEQGQDVENLRYSSSLLHHYLRREFSYSNYEQNYTLPDDVVKDQISAKVEDGILTVTMPKAEPKQKVTKAIEVS